MTEIKDFINIWTEENKQEYYDAAKQIWDHPELSMQEYKSMKVLTSILEKNSFSVETGAAGMPTAFIASYGSGKPVIGINAEYDALPGLSQKEDVSEKCPIMEGAPGQGCGHNLLGTAGVKAAVSLRYAMEKYRLEGTVRVIGAPAEELCLGKPYLGKAGYLKGYDAFLDWHPWSYTRGDYDSCSAYFSVKYHYRGKGCHGNSPWHGRSALDAAMLQAHAVEMLREHISPGQPPDAANTINYTFTETGPEFPSVVPDRTTIWFVGRFVTTEEAEDALRRVTDCARGAAISTGTEVETEVISATHHKIPNKVLARAVYDNLVQVGPPAFSQEEENLAKQIQREMGAPETGLPKEIQPFKGGYTVLCDTSEYSWNAPYASPWIAMGPENIGWHNWGVTRCAGGTPGLKSLDKAAQVIALTGADLLTKPELLSEAQEEWKQAMNGREYRCLLPEDSLPPVHLNEDVMKRYSNER